MYASQNVLLAFWNYCYCLLCSISGHVIFEQFLEKHRFIYLKNRLSVKSPVSSSWPGRCGSKTKRNVCTPWVWHSLVNWLLLPLLLLLFLLLHSPAIAVGFTILGEIFAHVTVFNPSIEVVPFRLCGWCMLGVFLLPAFTCLGHDCQDLFSPCDGMHVCLD